MAQTAAAQAPPTRGKVFRRALAYDLALRLFWGRREDAYRERVLQLAGVRSGDAVLDVGCGTGTLAIAAARRVGPGGKVAGVDASAQMIARAERKARDAGACVELDCAAAESLPFADASFDVVVSTTVLHCFDPDARPLCLAEMARVLKPGGRLLLVDFGGDERRSLMGHMHRHRTFNLASVVPMLRALEFVEIDTAPLGFGDLWRVQASRS
jgi:ubiquinone/menaquinone biosynthesis C-methylase UbiE